MTIYTDSPGDLIPRPLSDLPSSLGDTLSAEFKSGFDNGPIRSGMRFNDAENAAHDQSSPVVSKLDADNFAKSIGVNNVQFPEQGVRQSYLDFLQKKTVERAKTEQTLRAAPNGLTATPLRFIANMAGNAVDPGNVALMMVPFAGEAKAGSMLGRLGERFVQGAAMGAVQTGASIPFNAMATATEGGDYSVADAAGGLFMGALTGGIMHSSGGLIADLVKGKKTPVESEKIDKPPIGDSFDQNMRINPDITDQDSALHSSFDDGISVAKSNTRISVDLASQDMDNYAYHTAYNDIVPDWQSGRESELSGLRSDVADLKSQMNNNLKTIDSLDNSIKDRIRQYQDTQRMKFRDARSQAFGDIESERQSLIQQNLQIQQHIAGNAVAEQARGGIAALTRGEIPPELASKIESRAQEIKQGLQLTSLAKGIKTASQLFREQPWEVREQAMRSAVAQMMRGDSVNVQPLIDLSDPSKRQSAIESISKPQIKQAVSQDVNASRSADEQVNHSVPGDDLNEISGNLEHEINMIESIAGGDESILAEAKMIRDEAGDTTIENGIRKLAMCALRMI